MLLSDTAFSARYPVLVSPGQRLSDEIGLHPLESRALYPLLAQDIGALMRDANPVQSRVTGRIRHAYRSEIDGTPLVVADLIIPGNFLALPNTVFAHGPQVAEFEHLFQNNRMVAFRVSHLAEDETVFAVQAIDMRAGIFMPLRPLTGDALKARQALRLTIAELTRIWQVKEMSDLAKYGVYGVERLPAEIRQVAIAHYPETPVLAVDDTWTLETIVELIQLSSELATHDRRRNLEGFTNSVQSLARRGLVNTTADALIAEFIAEDTPAYLDGLHWESTDLNFDPATGTLTIAPGFVS